MDEKNPQTIVGREYGADNSLISLPVTSGTKRTHSIVSEPKHGIKSKPECTMISP
jgi:hypothetical protein